MKGTFAWAVSIAAVIVLILLFFGSMAAFTRIKEKRMETALKTNMFEIQLAIERYAVDLGGYYPPYLIGGDNLYIKDFDLTSISKKSMRKYERGGGALPAETIIDPLLKGGYLTSYPRNPFTTDPAAVARLQSEAGDPLRNDGEGYLFGCRFGASCTLMGNVMPDHRFPANGPPPQGITGIPAKYAGIDFQGYPMYDFGEAKKPDYYLPGMFFYKADRPSAFFNSGMGFDKYALGAYGGRRKIGDDVLGPATITAKTFDGSEFVLPRNDFEWLSEVSGWLKSKYADNQSEIEALEKKIGGGSPFNSEGWPMNPNGIPDGVIYTYLP